MMEVMRIPKIDDGYQHSPLGYCPLAPAELAALLKQPRVVHFDAEVVLARHYAAQLFNQKLGKRHIDLADELTMRLEQINFLCKGVAVLLGHYFAEEDGERLLVRARDRKQIWFMIYLYAESFYYFAHRVQDILGKPRAKLPHVTGFVPCRMVTLIRNQLIEHAYLKHDPDLGGDRGVISLNQGPVIRGRSGDDWPDHLRDPGMLVNARDFKKAVHPVLERALTALGGRVEVDADTLAEMANTRNKTESGGSRTS
jgi:hypothetical protein